MNEYRDLESLIRWRAHCEKCAMQVLTGALHLKKPGAKLESKEIQNKKDYFLYKFYEFKYEEADKLIRNFHLGAK